MILQQEKKHDKEKCGSRNTGATQESKLEVTSVQKSKFYI